ncbi:MAG TPA: carbon-nitrogen hydrolase family protein [Thermomicrobiales bacterium]|nr:carbon-nitrogen hydrolase family protein [Thermomicrobiales bacterium]
MAELTIALLQLTACGDDRDANLAKGDEYCRRASAMGADIALFPEMWSTGYTFPRPEPEGANDLWREPSLWPAGATSPALAHEADVARWRDLAIDRDSAFVRHFRALARELGMAIALTYLERWPGAPRNTVSLLDRRGEVALTYAKVHTCDFDLPEAACTPGDDFPVCALDTAAGEVRVGAMICYDREFPESARILMLRGAEIILTPNACELEVNRLAQFRTRAIENMVGAAMANYAAPQQNGHSVAYHPLAFDARGSRDTLVVEAGEGEGVYLARFDLDALRDWRRRETWGNAFRKPHRYALLTSLDVAPPFVRVDAAGARYDRARR